MDAMGTIRFSPVRSLAVNSILPDISTIAETNATVADFIFGSDDVLLDVRFRIQPWETMRMGVEHRAADFFLPGSIRTRGAAIRAIVAGVIAGSIMTLIFAFCGAMWYFRYGMASTTVVLATAALMSLLAACGVWKHVISGAVLGLLVSILFIVWALLNNQWVAAVVLVTPLVGGFWTAARGILTLKSFSRSVTRS